jgi:Ca2+-binding RTX toxin-like protein
MNASRVAIRRRSLFPRRAVAVAALAALLVSAGPSGIAQASWVLGGTWGAYDENGNELNVATRDIFGSDGASILFDSTAHVWVAGLDSVPDEGPHLSEAFINQDPSCSDELPRYYYSNDPFQRACWVRVFNRVGSTPGPWGAAFPIVAEGQDGTDLVFDHWEVIGSPNSDACFTGEIGNPQFRGPLLVDGPSGESDPVLTVGYKAFIDPLSETGFSGMDFTANAIYAPLTPDTSAPVVTIVEPLDCSVVEAGSPLIASFNCVDPGDPNPSCVGDVADGTFVDTSTAGDHSFSVVGTDAAGNTRTRTIRYTVIDTTAPDTTIDSQPSNPSTSDAASFSFSGSDTGTWLGAFECQLDGGGFVSCSSPATYGSLGDGPHTFQVRAVDVAGNVDPTPATYAWTIVSEVPNVPPTAAVTDGACLTTRGGSITLSVNDANGDSLSLVLSANSNPTLVPNSSILIGGSGSSRTISVTGAAGRSGVATLTFSLGDGTASVPVAVTVRVGTNQNESFNGTPGIDIILGLGGVNVIDGKAGADLLCGGSSSDALEGGDGDDILDGGSGIDALAGEAGADVLRGNLGHDLLLGGVGNDVLQGDQGNDVLTGGAGADAFSGGAGLDVALDFNATAGDTRDGTIP